MPDFTTAYFTMTEVDALEYARTIPHFFSDNATLSCLEIGDGNINYVFRVVDDVTKKSLIIKQAGPTARISDEFKLSPDRNRIETEILKLQSKLAPDLVPKVYYYDSLMNCCVMEDLSDHQILRKALLEYKTFPLFADHITTFLVNTLLLTSDVVLGHKEKKALTKNFINPELCEISEDLVYTEPFYNCNRNDLLPPTKAFAEAQLWSDDAFLLETAKLKFEFMTHAQSLIHGDLHTGSIFVTSESTKVIDPEFAFYGPAGYDIGNVIANLIFAYLHADAQIQDAAQKDIYKDWLTGTIIEIIDLFSKKFTATWKEHVTERTANYPGFAEYYLASVLTDTAAVTGCELCRRIIGLAHVADITSIDNLDQRLHAEKIALFAGKHFITHRTSIRSGHDFIQILTTAIARASQS